MVNSKNKTQFTKKGLMINKKTSRKILEAFKTKIMLYL